MKCGNEKQNYIYANNYMLGGGENVRMVILSIIKCVAVGEVLGCRKMNIFLNVCLQFDFEMCI